MDDYPSWRGSVRRWTTGQFLLANIAFLVSIAVAAGIVWALWSTPLAEVLAANPKLSPNETAQSLAITQLVVVGVGIILIVWWYRTLWHWIGRKVPDPQRPMKKEIQTVEQRLLGPGDSLVTTSEGLAVRETMIEKKR